MKKIILIAFAIMLLAGCTTRTQYGDCVGVADDKDPTSVYKLDVTNTVLSVIFFETVFVPVIVLADETFCPVGKR